MQTTGLLNAIACLSTLVAIAGCVTAPERAAAPAPVIAFPPPPEKARFVFERTLTSSADIKSDNSTDRLRRLVTGERVVGRGFSKPFDVAVCRGRIFVSDSVERVVMTFDIPERRYFEVGEEGPGALSQPLGLGIDGQCNLYVADATQKAVLIYDRDGVYQRSIGGVEWFNRLSHVAPSRDGTRVYAVDTGGIETDEHRVRVFDTATGQHLFDIGKRGDEAGEFNLPRDAELGSDGQLYVVDGANFRVQVFDREGRPVRAFGEVGRQTGQFSRPKGIAIDGEGRVYVTDTAFGNFQIFTPEGQLLLYVGSRSSRPEPAKYMLPAGIDVDEDGRVYMVDQYFRKVDIYRPAGLAPSAGHLGSWHEGAAPE